MKINDIIYDVEKVVDALLSMYTIKIDGKLYNVLDLSWEDLKTANDTGIDTFKNMYSQLFEIYDLLIEDIIESDIDADTITVLRHVAELLQM